MAGVFGNVFGLEETGTGPFAISFTVTDSTSLLPIELATVTLRRTGETATGATNASGQVILYVSAATFTRTVDANGYATAGASQVVTIASSVAVTLVATAVTPATAPGKTTVHGTFLDANGTVEQGVIVDLRLSSFAASAAGLGYDSAIRTAVSDSGGNVEFLGAWRQAVYEARRRGRHAAWVRFTTDDATTTALPVLIGDDDH